MNTNLPSISSSLFIGSFTIRLTYFTSIFVSFTIFVIFNIDLLIKIINPICAAAGIGQKIVKKGILDF